MHDTIDSRVTVLRRGGQFAVIAGAPIAPGDEVMRIEGNLVGEPSRYSVQVGANEHIDLGSHQGFEDVMDRYAWRFLNHSCQPNAFLRGRRLIARRTIQRFEEISFDYNANEFDMASPFECRCGAPGCLRHIRGFRHLTPAQQASLEPYLAAHLRSRLLDVANASEATRLPPMP